MKKNKHLSKILKYLAVWDEPATPMEDLPVPMAEAGDEDKLKSCPFGGPRPRRERPSGREDRPPRRERPRSRLRLLQKDLDKDNI